jgi:alkylation response protein AidB-like acyl-CoA dehydrogenase
MAATDTRILPRPSLSEKDYHSVRLAFEEVGAAVREETAAAWEEREFAWDLWQAMADAGLFADAARPEAQAMGRIAPAFDGLSYGLGQTGALIAAIVHASMGIPTIRDYAPEPVRSAYLERLERGDELLAYAITEPHGGTAAFTPETRVDRDGDEYVLNGRKWHITNAPNATVLIVWACDPEHDDIVGVLIDSDWDGVEIRRDGDPVGTCNAPVGSIFLEDVRVPADHMLAVGQGRRALNQGMLGERLTASFTMIGTMRHIVELALDFVLDREVAGVPLAGHQHMQRRVVDLRLRTDLARALGKDALARAAAGERFAAQASQLKMFVTRELMECALECAQVMGSYGVQRDVGLARAAMDGLCTTIAGGTEEAHRMVIFKDMVAERRAARSE